MSVRLQTSAQAVQLSERRAQQECETAGAPALARGLARPAMRVAADLAHRTPAAQHAAFFARAMQSDFDVPDGIYI